MKVHADRSAKLKSRPNLPRRLLNWYDANGRDLPWRVKGGNYAEPYHVWLSEIMLQQTTVQTVAPYFLEFLRRWPSVGELAAAPLDDVLHAWQGLGYYARARNLHKCAKELASQHAGVFPMSEAELRALPGIGPYTAAAIAAIAFDRPATVVDGNVERVMSRLYAVETELPQAKPELYAFADALTPAKRSGDYAQALMDLGATVCTPRKPQCARCPWSVACVARSRNDAESFPRRAPKPERPTRLGSVLWIEDGDGRVLIRRRPEKGLLGGMMEVPSSPWQAEPIGSQAAYAHAPIDVPPALWRLLPGTVTHTFTHFHLILDVRRCLLPVVQPISDAQLQWCAPQDFGDYAFPTVMKKVIRHVEKSA